jgi:folate-binding protein YgfZ
MRQIKLDYLSVTSVTGEDAETYLQAQLTADLTLLTNDHACFSAYCQPSGKVIAIILVARHQNGFFLLAAKDLMAGLISELSRFVLRADVRFEISDQPASGCPGHKERDNSSCFTTLGSDLHYGLWDSSSAGTDDPAEINRWRQQELCAGIVWLNSKTSAVYLPQMLGLESLGAVSFRKGCFPGQEVIARVRYLGKQKRRPVRLQTSEIFSVSPGSELDLLDAQGLRSAAVVIDSVHGPEGMHLFVVARAQEDASFTSIEVDGKRLSLSKTAHT